MKYPQLVSMPSAVQNWLEEQLEARGIDAAIYSRYILSLLRPDTFDHPDSFDLSTNTKVSTIFKKNLFLYVCSVSECVYRKNFHGEYFMGRNSLWLGHLVILTVVGKCERYQEHNSPLTYVMKTDVYRESF